MIVPTWLLIVAGIVAILIWLGRFAEKETADKINEGILTADVARVRGAIKAMMSNPAVANIPESEFVSHYTAAVEAAGIKPSTHILAMHMAAWDEGLPLSTILTMPGDWEAAAIGFLMVWQERNSPQQGTLSGLAAGMRLAGFTPEQIRWTVAQMKS